MAWALRLGFFFVWQTNWLGLPPGGLWACTRRVS